MITTIWSQRVELPTGFCYNCSAPASQTHKITSKGGIASSGLAKATMLGGLAGALREGAATTGVRSVPYCDHCVKRARGSFLDGVPLWLLKWYLKPGQTAVGSAFEILNEGKDLLRRNMAFIKIYYTNPRVLEQIKRLNPDVEIT